MREKRLRETEEKLKEAYLDYRRAILSGSCSPVFLKKKEREIYLLTVKKVLLEHLDLTDEELKEIEREISV